MEVQDILLSDWSGCYNTPTKHTIVGNCWWRPYDNYNAMSTRGCMKTVPISNTNRHSSENGRVHSPVSCCNLSPRRKPYWIKWPTNSCSKGRNRADLISYWVKEGPTSHIQLCTAILRDAKGRLQAKPKQCEKIHQVLSPEILDKTAFNYALCLNDCFQSLIRQILRYFLLPFEYP